MNLKNKEGQLILAIQAMNKDPHLSAGSAAAIYSVKRATLANRMKGMTS